MGTTGAIFLLSSLNLNSGLKDCTLCNAHLAQLRQHLKYIGSKLKKKKVFHNMNCQTQSYISKLALYVVTGFNSIMSILHVLHFLGKITLRKYFQIWSKNYPYIHKSWDWFWSFLQKIRPLMLKEPIRAFGTKGRDFRVQSELFMEDGHVETA